MSRRIRAWVSSITSPRSELKLVTLPRGSRLPREGSDGVRGEALLHRAIAAPGWPGGDQAVVDGFPSGLVRRGEVGVELRATERAARWTSKTPCRSPPSRRTRRSRRGRGRGAGATPGVEAPRPEAGASVAQTAMQDPLSGEALDRALQPVLDQVEIGRSRRSCTGATPRRGGRPPRARRSRCRQGSRSRSCRCRRPRCPPQRRSRGFPAPARRRRRPRSANPPSRRRRTRRRPGSPRRPGLSRRPRPRLGTRCRRRVSRRGTPGSRSSRARRSRAFPSARPSR